MDPSEQLLDLAFFSLDHGIDSVSEGGPLVPFIVIEHQGERSLHRFVAELLEEGEEQARAHLRAAADMDRAALAYDGYLTVDGERTDAIMVEAQERGGPTALVLAQRYRPRGRLRKFATIGNPAQAGEAPPLF